jgi:hypothetical protein
MYLACSSAYEWMNNYVRSRFSSYWTNKQEVELEAKGSLSRHRERAGGAKSTRERFEKDREFAPVKDAEFDRGDRGEFREKRVKFKTYVFYDIQDLGDNRPAGLLMIHPTTGQKVPARNQEAFDALASEGFKPDSSTILNAPSISIDLDTWRNNHLLRGAVKGLHFIRVKKGETNYRLPEAHKEELVKFFGEGMSRASPAVKSLFLLGTSPSKGKFTGQADREFRDMVDDGVINLESNIQEIVDKRCPHALAGKKCGDGCIRCANAPLTPSVKLEGIVGPVKRTPDIDNVYKIIVRNPDRNTGWEKVGTCFGAPLGLMTARHVFYGDTSDLLLPLRDFKVETQDGRKFEIEPMSLVTPSNEQLNPGQIGDFCRFQCTDKVFMKEVSEHRAAFRVLHGSGVRLLHYPPDSQKPLLVSGNLERKDLDTGMGVYDINTWESDSGAPIYSDDGHVVGLHHGYHKGLMKNVFLLMYPDQLVAWFVQSQPLN